MLFMFYGSSIVFLAIFFYILDVMNQLNVELAHEIRNALWCNGVDVLHASLTV